MVFKGTHITRGNGLGVAVATGMRSELGRISKLVEEASPETSPIERQINRLSGQLIRFTLAIAAIVGVVGVLKGQETFLMIEAAIALAVAAIPEGLPVVATMALARGMWRMARHNALIERLAAVETLGATTVILTDKTGTLTENAMQLKEVDCPDGLITITDNMRTFSKGGAVVDASKEPCLDLAMNIAVLCNNAELDRSTENRSTEKGIGDPLEQALLWAANAIGKDRAVLKAQFPRSREVAFDSASKMMATVHQMNGRHVAFIKGAPETVLALSTDEFGARALDGKRQAYWHQRTNEMAARGMRVLAVATKPIPDRDAEVYGKLTFVGLLGLYDPPRADVAEAIDKCRTAGIRVIMLTGDHAVTARNIAKAVNLTDAEPVVVEGRDLQAPPNMRPDELQIILDANVFARVSPAQKMDLIKIYQKAGHIVAMTGDGVNDAPALKRRTSALRWACAGRRLRKRRRRWCFATTSSVRSLRPSAKAGSSFATSRSS